MKETVIENQIKNFLSIRGAWVSKIQSGKITKQVNGKTYMVNMAEKGTPDMVGCYKGTFIAIEVKSSKEEVEKWIRYPLGKKGKKVKFNSRTYWQKERSKQIIAAGGFYFLVSSLNEFISDLKKRGL